MKVVGIGGGHGLSITLRAARLYADEVAAVVTVADDGGSSGRLTRDLGIPATGDIRNCLVALSDDGTPVELFQHRFSAGELEGHPIGNLVIAALAEMRGDFAAAVAEAGRLLGAKGHIYPATTELVALSALVEGGVVRGQAAVARSGTPIHSVHLKPSAPSAYPGAVKALLEADQIVIGPGSLFTSIIATLLVPGIKRALTDSKARTVFVCNARQQPGETDGLDGRAHIEKLLEHIGGGAIDIVIVQQPQLPDGVSFDAEIWDLPGIEVVGADVADPDGSHNPERLAKVLTAL